MARPDIAFTLAGEERAPVTWAAALPGAAGRLTRLGDILGADFRKHAIEVRSERDGVIVEGFAAAPALTRANALGQYLFVNGRPVRDKLILGAVRAAYADYLPRDRHPVVALFVTLDSREVDANVHPAKTEVRFRNAGLVRALIVHALKEGLAREGRRTAANSGESAIAAFRPAFAAAAAGRLGTGAARRPIRSDRGRRSRDRRSLPSRNKARPPSTSAGPPPMSACMSSRWRIWSTARSAPRAPRSTTPTSCRRPATASSSSTSTPRMSASSMSGSRPRWRKTACSGRSC